MNKKLSEMPVPAYARIVDEWYKVMGKNNISVQPKAATILGTILSKYDIKRKQQVGWDVYDQYMNTPVAELSMILVLRHKLEISGKNHCPSMEENFRLGIHYYLMQKNCNMKKAGKMQINSMIQIIEFF